MNKTKNFLPEQNPALQGNSRQRRAGLALRSKATKGFTLIEVLVIISLLGIVLVIGGNLFFSILKGGSKAEMVKEVKQNGDYAMSVMERMIRNAERIPNEETVCSGTSLTLLTIDNPDGRSTTFECLDVGTNDGRVASNSARLTSDNVRVNTCSISCPLGATPPVVSISFTLSPQGATQPSALFQTRVSLRTYE